MALAMYFSRILQNMDSVFSFRFLYAMQVSLYVHYLLDLIL